MTQTSSRTIGPWPRVCLSTIAMRPRARWRGERIFPDPVFHSGPEAVIKDQIARHRYTFGKFRGVVEVGRTRRRAGVGGYIGRSCSDETADGFARQHCRKVRNANIIARCVQGSEKRLPFAKSGWTASGVEEKFDAKTRKWRRG